MTSTSTQPYDLLIHGADVIDGTGAARERLDVLVRGDRVVALAADLAHMKATMTVDATGLTLAPGFIDAHTHDDRAVLSSPGMKMKVSQEPQNLEEEEGCEEEGALSESVAVAVGEAGHAGGNLQQMQMLYSFFSHNGALKHPL